MLVDLIKFLLNFLQKKRRVGRKKAKAAKNEEEGEGKNQTSQQAHTIDSTTWNKQLFI